MKKYVVMVDYGVEGWKIQDETDDFQEAVQIRESAMFGSTVVIFKPVELVVTEKEAGL